MQLDPSRHARILGAPGSGKTTRLVSALVELLNKSDWNTDSVVMLAQQRLVASDLRASVEQRVNLPLAGTPVRTPVALAFSLLQRAAAEAAVPPPTLLTGSAHDDIAAETIAEIIETNALPVQPFAQELVVSSTFRAELRELSRVLDDFALTPEELTAALVTDSELPALLCEQWITALAILLRIRKRQLHTQPGSMSASELLRAATDLVNSDPLVAVPRLLIVDDAQDIGEGALGLLAAMAARGTRIWAAGDPDIATAAFQGERTQLLRGVYAELVRKGMPAAVQPSEEQVVWCEQVFRHGAVVRSLVQQLSMRIGAEGLGQQRATPAVSVAITAGNEPAEVVPHHIAHEQARLTEQVEYAVVASAVEQTGVIAHRLRQRHIDPASLTPWSEMVVVCRTRAEVTRVSRSLAAAQVPTGVLAGGIAPGAQPVVRELLRVLQHALGIQRLTSGEVQGLLGGTLGGLDSIALRRLRGAIYVQEHRDAQSETRDPLTVDEVVFRTFVEGAEVPVVETRGGRRLRSLSRVVAKADAVAQAGATPREVLWTIWSESKVADRLQAQALGAQTARATEAHRSLDAVLGLFFALQRHEEQDNARLIDDLIDEILNSSIAEDSLAVRAEGQIVTVTTPQGLNGRAFQIVCVVGPQDGTWPNLRARGSALGVTALERWLKGEAAELPTRRETMHDEMRLLTNTVARAASEVLLVAVEDDETHPGVFGALLQPFRVIEPLPSARLTLRGAVAELRRTITADPTDTAAVSELNKLIIAGTPGAHPDQWYGITEASSLVPLVDLSDPDQTVAVSPSKLETVETCPLDWAISHLTGHTRVASAQIGTLFHHALETAEGLVTERELLDQVMLHWNLLRFDAAWEEERAKRAAAEMAAGIVGYLRSFREQGRQLLAAESSFVVPLGQARLRGNADRIELMVHEDGSSTVRVVDLKTGATTPTQPAVQQHAQLQAYQLGIQHQAFVDAQGDPLDISAEATTEAMLLYVHPNVRGRNSEGFKTMVQERLSEPTAEQLIERVTAAAQLMSAGEFAANVEHHCEDPYARGKMCALHIIPSVSHA